jgi:hypothetical protein
MLDIMVTWGRRFLKSLGLAALFGFASFLLSGSELSWILATGIFYYEFVVKGDQHFGKTPFKK